MTLSINSNLHCMVIWQLLACSAHVHQQGRFLPFRDLRRVLQQGQRHRLARVRLQRRRPLVDARVRQQHQHAAAAHAGAHAGVLRVWRGHQYALLLEYHGANVSARVSGPARCEHLQRQPGQVQCDPQAHGDWAGKSSREGTASRHAAARGV